MSVLLVDSAPGAPVQSGTALDSLKLVRFGRLLSDPPVVLAEITNEERFINDGEGIQVAPAQRDRGNIRIDAPWAGELPTVDRHGNARLTVGLRSFAQDPVGDVGRLVGMLATAPSRCAIEWRRLGAHGDGAPVYFPLRGNVDWTPTYRLRQRGQSAGMTVSVSCEVAPYAHRGVQEFAFASGLTWPRVVQTGAILGDLPALVDVHVLHQGGGTIPVFGLLAWWPQADDAIFGYYAPAAAGDLFYATTGRDDAELEVWATLLTASTRVLSVEHPGNGATRYSEFGPAGVAHPANSAPFKRLGRIVAPGGGQSKIRVSNLANALYVVPPAGHVRSGIGVNNDATYPKFIPTSNGNTRVIRHDGSGAMALGAGPLLEEHGLGRRVEMMPGVNSLVLRMADKVPSAPNLPGMVEQAAFTATVKVQALPRYAFAG